MRECVHDSAGLEVAVLVSIQLISPASGEAMRREQDYYELKAEA